MRTQHLPYVAPYLFSLCFGLWMGRWTFDPARDCTPDPILTQTTTTTTTTTVQPSKPGKPVHPCNTTEKGGCEQTCLAVGPSVKCACYQGYKLLKEGGKKCEREKLWRDDNHCGSPHLLPSGAIAQCNADGKEPCCSDRGWCGATPAHCKCKGCVDYRKDRKHVTCGSHTAKECSECPRGHGESWCNGDCLWCEGKCQPKGNACKSKGGRNDPVMESKVPHDKYAKVILNAAHANNTTLFAKSVTVVCFCKDKESFEAPLQLTRLYPNIKVLIATAKGLEMSPGAGTLTYMGEFNSKAEALNKLISLVTTDYFFHLDDRHHIEAPTTDQSVGWLLQALNQVRTLDLIGGSVHVAKAHKNKYAVLEVPCYRLHHYNYTYSETYEYRESIIDIMLCERTSTTFLANTTTYRSKGLSFDPRVGQLLFEDFFLQTKRKELIVATKQEVYFLVHAPHNQQRSALQHVTTDFIADLIPFGLKHHVMTIVDSDAHSLSICERFLTSGEHQFYKDEELLCEYDNARAQWKIKHWKKGSMFTPPTVRVSLKRVLAAAGDFFDTKGWVWSVHGGGALGALKTRGLLPWQGNTIKIKIHQNEKETLEVLRNEFTQLYPHYDVIASSNDVIIKHKLYSMGQLAVEIGGGQNGKVMRMFVDGHWVPCSYHMFEEFRSSYGLYYLQHNNNNCTSQSNTCLPNFSALKNGRAGMWNEFFVEKEI